MPLTAGTRLGPYEVIAPIGAGGMGEVYRARDVRLGRFVAIKVLTGSVSGNTESLGRFEQEARATSALNHPNVLVVHDIGSHNGAPYVVSELLDGAALRAQLTGTPFSPSRAIGYGIEVARGLAAAHDGGIVHRDIKPENLFVTRDGRVKILDFGIARMMDGAGEVRSDMVTKQITEPGIALGTVGYMSPEQVRGERVDQRSDIFALGVVLYEMLSGRRPFSRGSKIETLNAILTETPTDLAGTNSDVPPALDRVVRHCLEKDPAMRFQSARDVAFALEGAATPSGPLQAAATTRARTSTSGRRLAFIAGAGLVVVSAAALGALYARRGETETADIRFEIPAPTNGTLQGILGVSSVISPDGQMIVMAVTTERGPRLFVRSLTSTAALPLEGTEGGSEPFWSPDSRSIGFFTAGSLKRIPVGGGAPQTICDLPKSGTSIWRLASWGPDNTILFTGVTGRSDWGTGGVLRVAASGGQPALVASPPRGWAYLWPSFLPDGRHYLVYAFMGGSRPGEVRVGSLDSQETTPVVQAYSRALYAEPGYLLFVREGSLLAQAFDLRTLSVTGSSSVVAQDLLYFRDLGQADFSVSHTGVLAYQAGATASRLIWYRRDGIEAGQVGEPDDFFFLRLAPDGQRVAVDVMDRHAGTTDIRVYDLTRGDQANAVTSDPTIDWTPVFSPDGQQIAFASARRGAPHLHVKRITDQGHGEELLPPSTTGQFVYDWAKGPPGPFIVYSDESPNTGIDLMSVPVSGSRTPQPLVQTAADEMDGRVSTDGKWLAYVSNESGRSEVYVRALRASPDRWQVSTSGGVSPRWRRDGRELYYLATVSMAPFGTFVDGRVMAVSFATDEAFRAGTPIPLFNVRAANGQYEPSADGQRFLVNAGSGTAALPITVSTNWARTLVR